VDLSVRIPRDSEPANLVLLLQSIFDLERLDGANQYYCSNCNALRDAEKVC